MEILEEKKMKLDQQAFDILVYIEAHQKEKITQAELGRIHMASIGTVNKKINFLKDLAYIEEEKRGNYTITKKGYQYLEPFRVKRAILIAAGFGSRLIPITLNTPKPLIRVKQKRIIETLLDALVEKGITDIHIVRGYLGEQFDCLKEKYPTIKFYTNDKYNVANNISSAMLVKNLYKGAYVMDADLYLKNRDIIRKYEYQSNYLGIHVDKTDDWRLVTKNNYVTGMKIGGENCYQMIGLSYWTPEAGKIFEKDIVTVYTQSGGKECYWDEVVLGEKNRHYNIRVRPCQFEDITEIDTFEELKQIDPVYAQ